MERDGKEEGAALSDFQLGVQEYGPLLVGVCGKSGLRMQSYAAVSLVQLSIVVSLFVLRARPQWGDGDGRRAQRAAGRRTIESRP